MAVFRSTYLFLELSPGHGVHPRAAGLLQPFAPGGAPVGEEFKAMDQQDDCAQEGQFTEGRSHEGRTHEGPPTGRPEDRVEDWHPVISTTLARQGITLGAMRYVAMRYVLGGSLALVVLVLAVAYVLTIVIPHA